MPGLLESFSQFLCPFGAPTLKEDSGKVFFTVAPASESGSIQPSILFKLAWIPDQVREDTIKNLTDCLLVGKNN